MDIDASNWNEDDDLNTTAAPDGAPEGMAPSGVNNVLRAIMGAVKRWRNRGAPKTTAGTTSAYTLTYTIAPGALVDGMTHLVQFHATNAAGPTLNVNGLGATPLYIYGMNAGAPAWVAPAAGVLTTDMISRVAYHASSGAYRVLNVNGGSVWTPTDQSGAGLTLTSTSAAYRISNNLVHAYFTLTFPATSNGSGALIGGLPVTVGSSNYAAPASPVDAHGAPGGGLFKPVLGTGTFQIINASGSVATNANMSGLTVSGCVIYPAS